MKELIIIFYSDEKYEYQVKGVIESAILNIKGDYKLVYFTIDFDSQLEYKNLEKVRIERKENLPKFEYYKPSVVKKSIELFGDQNYLFVDTDILFGKRFDLKKFNNNKDYPMLSVGNWDFPYS